MITRPKFTILGCGPIGAIFATSISRHSNEVTIIDNNEPHLQKICSNGLEVIAKGSSKKVRFANCHRSLDELSDHSYDYLVVSLKTPVMERLIPKIAALVQKETRIISLQNGIGTEDFLSGHFGSKRVFRIIVNFAGILAEPGIIRQTFFHPPNYIGACTKNSAAHAEELASFLTNAKLDTVFTEDIKKHAWEKTAMNVAMSSVSALTGLDMKQAMEFKPTRDLVITLLEEIVRVGHDNKINWEVGYIEKAVKYMEGAGHHMPSMRLDLENKKETELNHLNQQVLNAVRSNNAGTLECITNLIRGIERSQRN